MAETSSLTYTFQPSMDPLPDINKMEDGASLTYSDDVNDKENDQQCEPTTNSSEENAIMQQFFTAASEGNVYKVQQCLKHVSDINQLDSHGSTALHLAVKVGNAEVVSLLLSSGADIHAKNGVQETALHLAAQSGK